MLLNQLGISLVVSTYQAGKLIVLRDEGGVINTHFRVFQKPMGLAATREKIAIGTAYQIWELRNVPAVGQKLDPPDKHDACYLPRQSHVTGDIDIHEMAYADDQLWFVNTRFSCLCTLDRDHSFVPRWRPPFVTAYDLSDRCHLNGLSLVKGQPHYVTALGETNTAAGWRANKAHGGILMDVPANQILCRGISMPHSPRWYQDRLWVLESGQGSLSQVDLATGNLIQVAELPGFTRGIDFCGPLAFIGLSQVRETAVFSGIPITERLTERICGVWVVHIETGQTVAFLQFEAGVEEIFAVQVLPGIRFPEVIDWDETLLGSSFVLPDLVLRELEITALPPEVTETPEHYLTLGNRCYQQGKLDEAARHYRRCLELDPNFLRARYNLGIVCSDLEQWEEGIQLLQEVIAAEPNHADAYNQLSVIYNHQNRLTEAIQVCQTAVDLRPDFVLAHFNLSLAILATGDFERGFAEYEWRWQMPSFTPLNAPCPQWDGGDIRDRTILIHTEQGAGDAIQFIRFVPMVAQRAQRVLLCCPDYLVDLFQPVPGIAKIYPPGQIPLSEFQTYVPLMSLAHLLKIRLETLPAQVPYLSAPLNSGASPWSEIPNGFQSGSPQAKSSRGSQGFKSMQTRPITPRLRVGIVWGGSPTHANDRHRSCRLEHFLPLLQVKGAEFFSLQKGDRTQELQQLPADLKLEDWDPFLNTFADTAGAISSLDMVISVDTSVAHLAGALAKPVWVLLCYAPDWRWMLDREDSPWYPTMRLFRQPQPLDWATVIDQVAHALRDLIQARKG